MPCAHPARPMGVGQRVARKRCLRARTSSRSIAIRNGSIFMAIHFQRRSLAKTRKAVLAPAFATDSVMHEEQSVGIIAFLDSHQPIEVISPECALPKWIKEVTLRNV